MRPINIVDISNNDMYYYDEYQVHKIRNCTCKQCRAAKKNKSKNTKTIFKRLMNKKRRKITLKPKYFTNYWA